MNNDRVTKRQRNSVSCDPVTLLRNIVPYVTFRQAFERIIRSKSSDFSEQQSCRFCADAKAIAFPDVAPPRHPRDRISQNCSTTAALVRAELEPREHSRFFARSKIIQSSRHFDCPKRNFLIIAIPPPRNQKSPGVQAVARADVRSGALPVLDDPGGADLRGTPTSIAPRYRSAMMVTRPPWRSRLAGQPDHGPRLLAITRQTSIRDHGTELYQLANTPPDEQIIDAVPRVENVDHRVPN